MVREELLRRLEVVLAASGDVRFALLFGSRATGIERIGSDVDLAFMPAGDWALGRELELQAALERVAGASVDLVRLDRASLLVAWEVARDGVKVFGADRDIVAFRTRTALDHADAAPLLGWAARRYAALVAEHGTGT